MRVNKYLVECEYKYSTTTKVFKTQAKVKTVMKEMLELKEELPEAIFRIYDAEKLGSKALGYVYLHQIKAEEVPGAEVKAPSSSVRFREPRDKGPEAHCFITWEDEIGLPFHMVRVFESRSVANTWLKGFRSRMGTKNIQVTFN